MSEKVDHPTHYHPCAHEAIDVIEAWGLGFALGNAVKYIARHKLKGAPLEDLRKARWYLDREIAALERASTPSAGDTCDLCDRPGGTHALGQYQLCESCWEASATLGFKIRPTPLGESRAKARTAKLMSDNVS